MTISALLARFTVIYIALLIAAGALVSALGLKGGSGFNTAILMGAVMWSCMSFGKANGRYFEGSEKTRVILGILVINLFIQLAMVALFAQSSIPLSSGFMLGVFIFIGLIHGAIIYFFVGFTGKQLSKTNFR
jgi:hypothetical protein